MKAYTVIVELEDRFIHHPIVAKTPLDLYSRITSVIDKFPALNLLNYELKAHGDARTRHYKRHVKTVMKEGYMSGRQADKRQ